MCVRGVESLSPLGLYRRDLPPPPTLIFAPVLTYLAYVQFSYLAPILASSREEYR